MNVGSRCCAVCMLLQRGTHSCKEIKERQEGRGREEGGKEEEEEEEEREREREREREYTRIKI